jgi:D-glycero-alpha-D-manno-heptose-7-phosphate kinase
MLLPYAEGKIRITSQGFKSAEYPLDSAPFSHPLGLMFAVAAYFEQEGIHIAIDSASPPKSGMGGSSSAAVALVAAFLKTLDKKSHSKKNIALLAHAIEGSVAGVPCGIQDQLAAVYGGIHAWYWRDGNREPFFQKKALLGKRAHRDFEKSLLMAYCGKPHESKRINQKWIDQFLAGINRPHWKEIISYTKRFSDAIVAGDLNRAIVSMNKETAIRQKMTPEVLDPVGEILVKRAIQSKCGARFTGAGGGGCVWALGYPENIDRLKNRWRAVFDQHPSAHLLDAGIDSKGLLVETSAY